MSVPPSPAAAAQPSANIGNFAPSLRLGPSLIVWTAAAPFQAIRTVDIERTASGVLVVAWRAEPESQCHVDMGHILCATSRDGGLTWSEPASIATPNARWAYANVVLFAHDDALHAFVGRCPAGSAHSEQQEIVSRVSRDDGATWSDGALEMRYPHPTIGGGKVIRFGNRFLMPFHRNDHGFANKTDQTITRGHYPLLYKEKPVRLHGVLVSEDLRRWELGGVVPQADTDVAPAFFQEGFLAPAADGTGELLLVMREGDWHVRLDDSGEKWTLLSQGRCVHVSRSRDGLAWSPSRPWPAVPNHNVKGAFLTDSHGRHIAFYNDAPDRERLFVMATPPHAPDIWSAPVALSGGEGWNCYAMTVEAPPESGAEPEETRLLVAYESGKQRIIFQEIFVK